MRHATLVLIVRAQEQRGAQRLHGSSDFDGPLIADAITQASLCTGCIAQKTGLPASKVGEGIARVAATLEVTTRVGRCHRCLEETVVHRIG